MARRPGVSGITSLIVSAALSDMAESLCYPDLMVSASFGYTTNLCNRRGVAHVGVFLPAERSHMVQIGAGSLRRRSDGKGM
jgi:hypothetical protein